MPLSRFKKGGYGTWCQRDQCHRCKSKDCECPHHPFNGGGVADPEILAQCKKMAIGRAWLGHRCQENQCKFCKTVGCHCKCHASDIFDVEPEPLELPVASEANVLELQERVYAVSADFQNAMAEFTDVVGSYATQIDTAKQAIGESIKEFDQRLAMMEKAKKLEVHVPIEGKPGKTKKVAELGVVHKDFEEIVSEVALQDKGAMYLVGGAGGGKTHLARQAHIALGRKIELFYSISVGLQTTMSHIMGYTSPTTGECFHSPLQEAFRNGGTCLVDEADAANAGVFTAANAVFANDWVQFGCKCPIVQRHKDARFIVAANTFGKGADHIYVGRNQLDGATLDRFVFYPFDYDWDMVKLYTGDVDGFTTYVSRLYECAAELKLRVVIGPRKAEYGCKRLLAGKDRKRVEELVIWSSIDLDDRKKLEAAMERKYPEVKFDCGKCSESFKTVEELASHDEEEHTAGVLATEAPEDGDFVPQEQPATPYHPTQFCPKCNGKNIQDNTEANKVRRAQNRRPLPDFKCMTYPCKWKRWPVDYIWPPKGAAPGTEGKWV